MTQADVSIVIPTKNGGSLFRKTLEGIEKQESSLRSEVVVIDSGSNDGTQDLAKQFGCRVLEIDPRSFNHGATRDHAIGQTTGRFIVLTVQDAEPEDSRWMHALVTAIEEVDGAVAAYSRQIPRPGLNPILRDRLQNWSASRVERCIQRLPKGVSLDHLEPLSKLQYVAFDNVSSCLRREAWESHPFGHQRFGEDIRWATLEIAQGRSIVFEPKSAVIHSHDSPVWYEFRRIFADHRNLSDLLGIETVPKLSNVRSNARNARAHYRSILDQEPRTREDRSRLERWTHRYSWSENLAQYLGARMTRWAKSGPWKRAAGKRIERWLGGV